MKKTTYHRRTLVKDVFLFQIKLLCDALRDFALSPIAIFLGCIDFITGAKREDSLFQKLMELGIMSDRWINLFGDHVPLNEVSVGNVDQWANDMDKKMRKRKSQ